MGNSSVIQNRNEFFFDPFQGMGGGTGTAGGGSGAATGVTSGLAATVAALIGTIIKDKTKNAHLENLKPGTENKQETLGDLDLRKPEVTYPGVPQDLPAQEQKQALELPYLPNAGTKPQIAKNIPSDLAIPGAQELPYLPNAGTKPQIAKNIPSDLAIPGAQELPYLPNAGTKPQEAEKEASIPTIPPISEGLPSTEIKDETQTNVEQDITAFDMQSMYDFILQQQQRQWDREDAIREQTRYDQQHAYEYAVESARRAGINPNLVNIQPATSGGGITNATGLDYSPWTAEINKQLALVEQEIENNFKGDENSKDRLTKGLTSLLQLFSLMALKG